MNFRLQRFNLAKCCGGLVERLAGRMMDETAFATVQNKHFAMP